LTVPEIEPVMFWVHADETNAPNNTSRRQDFPIACRHNVFLWRISPSLKPGARPGKMAVLNLAAIFAVDY
jgi:hypothetical protein